MSKIKILLVENNKRFDKTIIESLEKIGNITIHSAEILKDCDRYDLAIINIVISNINSFDILKNIPKKFPIISIYNKNDINTIIKGYQLGINEYIIEPFLEEKLINQVNQLLQKHNKSNNNDLSFAGFKANLNTRFITFNNKHLKLTDKESEILIYFLQNPNTVITKEQIFNKIWGPNSSNSKSIVEVYISDLRKKIKKATTGHQIKTVRYSGYIMQENIEEKIYI